MVYLMPSWRPLRCLQLIALLASSVHAWNCYLPDGSHDNVGMKPCNATLADTPEGSACCDPRDACTTSGMCLGESAYTYRGGCTDPTFAAAGCPSMCLIDPVLQQKYSKNPNIISCEDAGVFATNVCCQSFSGDSCCNSSFQFANSGFAFKPGWDATLAQLAQGQAALAQLNGTNSTLANLTNSSNTSSQQPDASSHSGSSHDHLALAIGVGVGVPVAVLALGLLSFLFYKERNKHALNLAAARSSSPTSKRGREIMSQAVAATSPISGGSGMGYAHPTPSRSNSEGLGTKTDVSSGSAGGVRHLGQKGSRSGAENVGQMGRIVTGSPMELSGEDRKELPSGQNRYEVPG